MNKSKILYLIGMFLLLFIMVMWIDNEVFFYDASGYWNLGYSFWDADGDFSFLNYPVNIRGYVLPFILGLCMKSSVCLFGDAYIIFRIFYCIIGIVMSTIVVPKLFHVEIGTKRWMTGSTINIIIFMFFWKDFIICPLSDLIALFMYCVVLLLLERLLVQKRVVAIILYSICTGALMYCAYNIRTVYLVPIILLIVFCVGKIVLRREWKRIFILVFMFIGAFLVSIPQISINKKNYNKETPMVITAGYGNQENLFVGQLQWGISFPRYETYVGNVTEYPAAGVKWVNSLGEKISTDEEMTSISDYVKFVLKNPLEMAGIYFEHLVSGMTLFYNEAYIKDISINMFVFLANFLLWFIGLIGVLSNTVRISKSTVVLWCGACFPALLALPGAVEPRFFLPVYLALYGYITFVLNVKDLCAYVKANMIKVFSLFVMILVAYLYIANNLLSQLQYAVLDFGGNVYLK